MMPWRSGRSSQSQSQSKSSPATEASYFNEPQEPSGKLRQLIDAVNTAITPTELRLSAIAETIYEFDHRDKSQHDMELHEGAANVLFQKLAFATQLHHPETDHEIAMISAALEMVYRASDMAIERSFEEIGRDILPLFSTVISRVFEKEEGVVISKDDKIAVQKITKVLSAYSLVPSAKIPLAHQRGMLTSLVKVIDITGFNRSKPLVPDPDSTNPAMAGTGTFMTEAARFNAIATITNLAFAEGNRAVMMAEPGLVLNVSMVANMAQSEMARQCAALAIMNLSHAPGVESPNNNSDMPDFIGNDYLLDTLVNLMEDDRPDTRRNAAISLYNLASTKDNAALLARYGEAVVMDILVEIMQGDHTMFWNQNARLNAAETMFHLSCKSKDLAMEMAHHPIIIDVLTNSMIIHGTDLNVQIFNAATLRRISVVVTYPNPSQEKLLYGLMRASSWFRMDAIVKCFEDQAELQENRSFMVNHPGLLNTLSKLALSLGEGDVDIRASAIFTLEKLSREDDCRGIMARNESVMMALTRGSHDTPENELLDFDSIRRVKAVLKALVVAL